MNELFDRIEREVIPEIEKALGRQTLIGVHEDGRRQFKTW